MYMNLTQSYGRDCKTAKEVREMWAAGKDFTVADLHSPHCGRQINRADAPKGATMLIRYKGLTNVCVIKT